MRKVGWGYHPIFLEHHTGGRHPERKSRLEMIIRQLKRDNLYESLIPVPVLPASTDWIEMVHDPIYINRFEQAVYRNLSLFDSPDTPISKMTFEAALMAVGTLLSSADQIINGVTQRVFCAVRPPGHHAERNRSMGFCFFNNVAVLARYLQKKYDVKKIFIIDWDVHHGNGTQHYFERDNSVFYCSLHQENYYPGTGYEEEIGLGQGRGFNLNCPMKIGCGDNEYIDVFEKSVIPALTKFQPDFIIISAGFDGHSDDPLGGMNLSEKGFEVMTRLIAHQSDEFCDGRIISVLEGGYNLVALGKSVSKHIQALMDE